VIRQRDITEVSNGMGLLVSGDIYSVVDFNHVKPAKGSAFVRIKMRSLKTGNVLERTYRTAERLEEAVLEFRRVQYLYHGDDGYHFMDHTTFEEQVVTAEMLGHGVDFLQDNMEAQAVFNGEKLLNVEIPNFITATITETDLGLKGDSSRAGNKPAKIDTGATVQVPLFIGVGDVVKIDTRDGTYVERAKK
jgi:elongation factor P